MSYEFDITIWRIYSRHFDRKSRLFVIDSALLSIGNGIIFCERFVYLFFYFFTTRSTYIWHMRPISLTNHCDILTYPFNIGNIVVPFNVMIKRVSGRPLKYACSGIITFRVFVRDNDNMCMIIRPAIRYTQHTHTHTQTRHRLVSRLFRY